MFTIDNANVFKKNVHNSCHYRVVYFPLFLFIELLRVSLNLFGILCSKGYFGFELPSPPGVWKEGVKLFPSPCNTLCILEVLTQVPGTRTYHLGEF